MNFRILTVARILFFLLFFFLWACEKDDICVDGDTPHLIIRFYDKDNPEFIKAVTNLRVVGEGIADPISSINRSTTDSIAIPLRALSNDTTFSFISNSADDEDGLEIGNTDRITFNYLVEEVFVSRACGYIANYDDLEIMITNDGDNWIDTTQIVNTTVTNEAAAHIIIYH